MLKLFSILKLHSQLLSESYMVLLSSRPFTSTAFDLWVPHPAACALGLCRVDAIREEQVEFTSVLHDDPNLTEFGVLDGVSHVWNDAARDRCQVIESNFRIGMMTTVMMLIVMKIIDNKCK